MSDDGVITVKVPALAVTGTVALLSALLATSSLLGHLNLWPSRHRPSPNRKLRYSASYAQQGTLEATVARLREGVAKRATSRYVQHASTEVWSAYWREQQLYGLHDMLKENADELFRAAQSDIGKPYAEFILELTLVLAEIRGMIQEVRGWMQPEKVVTPLFLQPSESYVIYEPFGLALVVGAWNLPIQTTITPLCAVIAAGNACIVKPNEMAPAQADFFAKYLPRYVDPDAIAVITGDAEVSRRCVAANIDLCFFTGSSRVGRLVATSCAQRHVPCVLELGGKSPCIIDPVSCDLNVMARRLVQTKHINSGQVCLAPDHVIVLGDEAQARRLIEHFLVPEYKRALGENPAPESLTRIINDIHFQRLKGLLEEAKESIVYGGGMDAAKRFIEPTILLVDAVQAEELGLFKEEVFGPVLPIVYVPSIEQVVDFVSKRQNPLAVYLFSRNSRHISFVQAKVPTGSVCINDCCFQAANPNLPFGGVRESGVGRYHGRSGFVQCSNAKAVMHRSDKIDFSLRYNPAMKEPWVQRLMGRLLEWTT